MHLYIEDICERHIGRDITLKGWLDQKTDKGRLRFLKVRDGTGIIQAVVFEGSVSAEVFQIVDRLTQESSLIVSGQVRADKRAPSGFELDLAQLEVVQVAEPYPITPKEHGTAFLMDQRHLWLRSSRQQAILRVRDELIKGIRDFFDRKGFVLLDTPIITPAACENTTTLFNVQYFEQKAYLTQSGQLYNEAACMSMGKVYCFGPTFRAEKSKTRRHLTEFWMVEPEAAYLELEDLMALAEDLVCDVVGRVLERKREELERLGRDTSLLEKIASPFPRITYAEAFDLLEKEGTKTPRGSDFGGGDETIISSHFERPILVHRYPARVKAFYMQPDPENAELALCLDLLAPEGYGEIIGGSQRIHDYDLLLLRLKEHNLPLEDFRWYLDLRKYGSVPHSGFGMGIERVLAWLCGLDHVRETIPFPRMLYRLYP